MERVRRCGHRRLVAEGGCRVDQCGHGTVHLTIGDVTLRLSAAAFQSLAATLGQAAARVEESDPERPHRLC